MDEGSTGISLRIQNSAITVDVRRAMELLESADIETVQDVRKQASAMESVLKVLNASADAQFSVSEVKLLAEMRLGVLLAAMEKRKNQYAGDTMSPALADLGIDKKQSSRWQLEARVGVDKFDEWKSGVKERGEELTQAGLLRLARGKTIAASANTGEVEWYTPTDYIEMARTVMGGIDTDPASSDAANEVVRADTYYTVDDDGLEAEWHGNVWMNPPYAAGVVGQFTAKLCEEIQAGRCRQAIVLLNNATDTRWFADVVSLAAAVCFKTGRIAFVNADGEAIAGAAQGQVFLYFGKRIRSFLKTFSSIGWVAEVVHE